jgi:3-hydroxyacyl-CoA dehydrogenase/3a,7a,12a-trihydroxy-5b-cholest-24-enoyl-CoA hydratase
MITNLFFSNSSGQTAFKYDFKDAILYALSLGISTSNEQNLKFLYENHSDFSVLPSFGVLPAFAVIFNYMSTVQLPHNLQIDPAKILHGEHYLEIFKPLRTAGALTVRTNLTDVCDKGSGAALVIDVELLDERGERVALNQFVTFAVGSGNFGGKRDSDRMVKVSGKKFERAPDATLQDTTSVDQAALYRLNGDFNPLHIDPSFSAILGFDRPILHGLCTFGYAVKHIIQTFCGNDVTLFKSVKVRFAKPVLPGQTIQTNMWLDKEAKRVYFECKVRY